MSAMWELCAALEVCLPFFYSPSDATRKRGERLQRTVEAAARAAGPAKCDEEARSKFCRLLGELGGAMAAVARSPAAVAAFEPGGRSLEQVVAGAQLDTACAVITRCSRVALVQRISGGSDTFRWVQSWRLLAELGRRSVQSGLASASQPSGGARATAALLAGAGTQAPLHAVLDRATRLLTAAQSLLCMLSVPGSERTLVAFGGTTAASTDTVLLLAVTSTALSLCIEQGVETLGKRMRFFEWADVCGALLADPTFARVQGLMQAQPHMQAAIAGLLLRVLPATLPELTAAADVGGAVLNMSARITLRLLQLAGAPSLHAGLQQALGQCSGGSGEAALEALAQLVGFAAQLHRSEAEPGSPESHINDSAEAVCAWGQVCAALAQSGPAGDSPLLQTASRHSVMLLPALVELAGAALQEQPAGGGQGHPHGEADAAAVAATDLVMKSLAAAAQSAANFSCLHDDGSEEPLLVRSYSMLSAAEAAIRLVHMAAERQAVAASAGGDSCSSPCLSAVLEAGTAAAVSCLGDMLFEPGWASEQVSAESDGSWEEAGSEGTDEVEDAQEAAVPNSRLAVDRAMQAVAVAHAEAMSAALAAMESGSSHVPCEGQPADELCCVLVDGIARAALLVTESTPGCCDVVGGSPAAMGTLCSALDRALQTSDKPAAGAAQVSEGQVVGDANARTWRDLPISSCMDAAAACPQLAAALLTRGLLGRLVKATLEPNRKGGRPLRGELESGLRKLHAIMVGLVQACQEAAGSSSMQADAAAGGVHSTAGLGTHSASLDLPAAVLGAAAALAAAPPPALPHITCPYEAACDQSRVAALHYLNDAVLPTAQPLGEALHAFHCRPEQAAAARLAIAQAAAARSCAYLRCANVGATGGPAAGEQPGSKRCGGCRVVRFCDTACSHADWRARHRRVCKQLAAARLAAQQSEYPAAEATASGDAQ